MLEKLLRRWPLWALALGVLAFIADLQGALDFGEKHVLPALRAKIPFAIVVPLLLAAGTCGYAVARRIRKRVPDVDPATILTQGAFYERMQTFLTASRKTVTVVGLDKDWIFPLAVSVFVARQKNVSVEIIC